MKIKQFIVIWVIICSFINCTKYDVIYDGDANTDFNLALILQLDNKDCSYDSPSKTLRFSIKKEKLFNFSPLVKFQDHSQIKFEGNLLSNNSINALGNLEINKKYEILITTMGHEESLFLEFTEMPIVQIVTLNNIANEEKVLGKLSIKYSDPILLNFETFIGIEFRGRSSIYHPKKSYSVKPISGHNMNSNTNISFFGLPSNNKWSLDAMYIDKSFIRNKLSYEIWGSIYQNSIKSDYVELFHNTESKGLYRLSENYTYTKLNLTNESVMYAGLDNTDFCKFYSYPIYQPRSLFWEDWEQIYPDPSTKIYWSDFTILADVIVNSSDSEFISKISEEIDIDQLIDYYLFIELCYAYDNAGKNWRFLKMDQQSKFNILLWDVDATWGRNHLGNERIHNLNVYNNLFDRLIELNPNNFKNDLKSRWQNLRGDEFSSLKINTVIDSNINQLLKYRIVEIDNDIWNKSNNLITEKNYMKNWISKRLVYMDTYINSL